MDEYWVEILEWISICGGLGSVVVLYPFEVKFQVENDSFHLSAALSEPVLGREKPPLSRGEQNLRLSFSFSGWKQKEKKEHLAQREGSLRTKMRPPPLVMTEQCNADWVTANEFSLENITFKFLLC